MTELERRANDMRADIVRMIAEAGSGHPGGSLSCADILAALYFGGVLEHDPENPEWEGRDRFILAKGHAATALYAALAQAGYIPREELAELRGDRMDNTFGSQIRNYVLYPYQMVKDVRSGVETGNVDAVLDGDLEEFVIGYHKWRVSQ